MVIYVDQKLTWTFESEISCQFVTCFHAEYTMVQMRISKYCCYCCLRPVCLCAVFYIVDLIMVNNMRVNVIYTHLLFHQNRAKFLFVSLLLFKGI